MSAKIQKLLVEYSQNPAGDHMADYPEVEQWKVYYRKISAAMRSELKKNGYLNVKFTRGHKSLSGFVTHKNGTIVYISISADFNPNNVLIRTATSYKDFTGGRNQYTTPADLVFGVNQVAS